MALNRMKKPQMEVKDEEEKCKKEKIVKVVSDNGGVRKKPKEKCS